MKILQLNPNTDYTIINPVYGETYAAGFTGFTCSVKPDAFQKGIAWFTRFDRLSDIEITHALTVTGPNTCVEALYSTGVTESPLSKYFDADDVLIFFRKPRNLDEIAARIIVNAVYEHVGDKYDTSLLAAQLYSGTFFGHLASLISSGKTDAFVAWLLDHPEAWICSEYVAWALNKVPKLSGHGVLRYPAATINPKELFQCDITYTPWNQG
ncbi:MAG: hypothetical protein PHP44_11105 [Kiritimatiellae bacterium]|nr:hypothetical protein [Kiritimatiellia bacterium]